MPRALISVTDKTGIVELARNLATRGYELVSTGGTARALREGGLEVVEVSEITGFPEMMDGRVKTLHPAVFASILARRSNASDMEDIRKHGFDVCDIVVVNLYAFAEAVKKETKQDGSPMTFGDLVEEIDIGGPSLLRAAAKNFRHVLVVCQPQDYGVLIQELDKPEGLAMSFRLHLASKVFGVTCWYDHEIWRQFLCASVTGVEVRRLNFVKE